MRLTVSTHAVFASSNRLLPLPSQLSPSIPPSVGDQRVSLSPLPLASNAPGVFCGYTHSTDSWPYRPTLWPDKALVRTGVYPQQVFTTGVYNRCGYS